MRDRYRTIVDVHLFLVRGGQVLLSRRAGHLYGGGLFHLVSGHLEEGEDVVAGMIREAGEEIGIGLVPDDLTCVHVMHHRSPEGGARVGFFFRAERWDGEPLNREPDKCSELRWWPLDQGLPSDSVEYPAEGVRRIVKGETFSLHGWPSATPS